MTDHRPPAKRHCQSSILDLFLARCSIEDAIMNGNAKLVKEFLQLLRYPPKGKLLHLAIKSKQEEIAKILVEHGVDVDHTISLLLIFFSPRGQLGLGVKLSVVMEVSLQRKKSFYQKPGWSL